MRTRGRTQYATSATIQRAPRAATLLALILLAAGAYLGVLHAAPPAPLAATASQELFSAKRAEQILGRLLADEAPRPTGSTAGEAAVGRIVAEFERAGYTPELQREWGCRAEYAVCSDVTNVIATLPGTGSGAALILTAHHDSVGASPGASDDMASVAAILEVARMLRSSPPLQNTVVFLITGGEEVGLTGAEAFLKHPLAERAGLVANFEARGTTGASLLFQTSEGNAWLMDRYLSAASRPATSSLYQELYRRLPNDTDLSVYLEAGLAGVNFAFIGGAERYHTSADDLNHLSLAALQHQGENVAAAVRAFGNEERLRERASGSSNAIYRDLFPGVGVTLPESWAAWLAAAALLLWLLIAAAQLGARSATPGGLLLALLSVGPGLLAGAGLGYAATLGMRTLSEHPAPWHAHPAPTLVALFCGAVLGPLLLTSLTARAAGFWGVATAVWLWWSAASLAVALTLPGASVVLLTPALLSTLLYAVLTVTGAGAPGTAARPTVGWFALLVALLSVALTAYLTAPLALMTAADLGFEFAAPAALLAALAASAFLPFLAGTRGARGVNTLLLIGLTAAGAGALLLGMGAAPYSEEAPRLVNVNFVQVGADGRTTAAYQAVEVVDGGPTPGALQAALPGANPVRLPGGLHTMSGAQVEPLPLPLPAAQVVTRERTSEGDSLSVRLSSPRGADSISLLVPAVAGLKRISVPRAEREFTFPAGRTGSYDRFACHGPRCHGLEVHLLFANELPSEIIAVDVSSGVPPGTAPLIDARPATAAAFGEGNVTRLFNTVALSAAEADEPPAAAAP